MLLTDNRTRERGERDAAGRRADRKGEDRRERPCLGLADAVLPKPPNIGTRKSQEEGGGAESTAHSGPRGALSPNSNAYHRLHATNSDALSRAPEGETPTATATATRARCRDSALPNSSCRFNAVPTETPASHPGNLSKPIRSLDGGKDQSSQHNTEEQGWGTEHPASRLATKP